VALTFTTAVMLVLSLIVVAGVTVRSESMLTWVFALVQAVKAPQI
jgi:hypothetical protein